MNTNYLLHRKLQVDEKLKKDVILLQSGHSNISAQVQRKSKMCECVAFPGIHVCCLPTFYDHFMFYDEQVGCYVVMLHNVRLHNVLHTEAQRYHSSNIASQIKPMTLIYSYI